MSDVTREIFLPISGQPSIETPIKFAERAEQHGYERTWTAETWGRDAITTLTTIAERTDVIGIGTSITSVYSRSPALIGQTAATIHESSGGRFRLGLGASTSALVERWHGGAYEQPLRRLREGIEIVGQVVAGDSVEYDGDIYQPSGFRLRFDPPDPPPAIDAAAMGPKAVELAGRFADGCHTTMFTPDGLRDRLEDLSRGADIAGRAPTDVRVMLELPCCALGDGERARWLARQHVAFYIGGMGPFYRDCLARQGYADSAHEIAQRWGDDDREGAMNMISDELLDKLAAAGTPSRARESLKDWASVDGLDAIAVVFPVAADKEEIEATIDALAP